MTDEELQQIEESGQKYCAALSELIDGMPVEAQVHMARLVFNATLVQLLNRRGPVETCSLLRRMAQRIENDAQRVLQ